MESQEIIQQNLLSKIENMYNKSKFLEIILEYSNITKDNTLHTFNLETQVQILYYCSRAYCITNQSQKAFEILKPYEEKIDSFKEIHIKLIIICSKLYLLLFKWLWKDSQSLFEKWDQYFNSHIFTTDLELKWLAIYYHIVGFLYTSLNEINLSQEYYIKSLNLKKELQKKGYEMRNEICFSLNNLGYNAVEEELDIEKGRYYFEEELRISKEINNMESCGFAFENLGECYLKEGDLDNSLKYQFESVACFEKIHSISLCHPYDQISLIYLQKGQYDKAMTYIQKSKEINPDDFGTTFRLASYYKSIGDLKMAEGVLNDGYQKFNKTLYKNSLSFLLLNLSNINFDLGKKEDSLFYLEQALDLFDHYPMQKSFIIFGIFEAINILLRHYKLEKASKLFEKIKNKKFNNKEVNVNLKFVSGLLLKHNSRLKERLKAIDVFKTLLDELESGYIFLRVNSISHLLELLILEYKSDENPEIMEEIKYYLSQYSKIADKRNSPAFTIDSYIIQSKMSIILGNIDESLNYLEKAKEISLEKDLTYLNDKIQKEMNRLNEEIAKHENFSINAMDLNDRIKLSQLDTYVKEVQQYLKPDIRI